MKDGLHSHEQTFKRYLCHIAISYHIGNTLFGEIAFAALGGVGADWCSFWGLGRWGGQNDCSLPPCLSAVWTHLLAGLELSQARSLGGLLWACCLAGLRGQRCDSGIWCWVILLDSGKGAQWVSLQALFTSIGWWPAYVPSATTPSLQEVSIEAAHGLSIHLKWRDRHKYW